MRSSFASLGFVAAMLLAAPAAYAMPVSAAPAVSSDLVRVAGGCGAGMHRGPYGGCRMNYANPAAHACPRGYHVGPNGGCRGNGR
jgi:hypothetical protein